MPMTSVERPIETPLAKPPMQLAHRVHRRHYTRVMFLSLEHTDLCASYRCASVVRVVRSSAAVGAGGSGCDGRFAGWELKERLKRV